MDNYPNSSEQKHNLIYGSRLDSDSSFMDSRYEDNQSQITNTKFLKKNKITESFETLLGSRLILNKDSNMLIFKPYIIFEILNHLKSSQVITTKLEIIEKLQWLINRLHPNAFIITYKADLKEFRTQKTLSFLDELVDFLIENNRDIALINSTLSFINDVIYNSGVKPTNFWYILQKMAMLFKDDTTYDGNKFLLMLKLINAFLTRSRNDGKIFPQKFFYFNNYMSELKVNSDTLQLKNISLAKGFTIVMWIRAEKINQDASNKKIKEASTLFYIHTNKFIGFEAELRKKSIFYRTYNTFDENESNNSSNESFVHLADIDYNKWYFILFTHKPVSFLQKPEVIIYINNDIPYARSYDYPNVSNQKISSIGLFKEFTGEVSNVFMFNDSLSQSSIINEFLNFNFGLYSERNIRIFKDYLEKMNSESNKSLNELRMFFESLIFMYSPSRIKGSVCKDLINNVNAELSLISEGYFSGGVCVDNNYASNIALLGGLKVLLPIFNFIFSNKFGTPIVLEEAMNILIKIFNNKDYYSNNTKSTDIEFFAFLSNIIEKNSPAIMRSCTLFTKDILEKFIALGNILIKNVGLATDSYAKEYFKQILFNPRIFCQYDLNLQIELWKKIETIYQNQMQTIINISDARNFFELIIKVYDNDIDVYCCDSHMKMLCDKKEHQSNKALPSPNYTSQMLLDKISHLLNIINMILTNRKVIAIDQMNHLIPFLAYEISPCLQKSLILIFHKVICGDAQGGSLSLSTTEQYISAFIKNKGIEHLLYLTTISTLDVRYECIKMFDMITQNEIGRKEFPFNITDEFIPFVSHTYFPLRTPLRKHHSYLFDIRNSVKSIDPCNEGEGIGMEMGIEKKMEYFDDEMKPNKIDIGQTPLKDNSISPVLVRDNQAIEPAILQNTSDMKVNNDVEYLITLLSSKDMPENKPDINLLSPPKEEIRSKGTESIKRSAISNKESLFALEDGCWKKITTAGALIQNLSLPILYIHDYSNSINDSYVEKIYNYLIKWLVNRYSINDEVIQLDDNDNIYFESVLNLIMQLVIYSSIILKQRCLTDLYVLMQYNKLNCCTIIRNKYFYQWLLDLLLTYQIILLTDSSKNSSESGMADMILSQGMRIHTMLIINSIQFEDEREKGIRWTTSFYGFDEKYIPSRQPKQRHFDHSNLLNQLLTWMYKIRKIGVLEGKAATIIIRTLLNNLIERFKVILKKKEPCDRPPVWKTFLSTTLLCYELAVMANFDKKIHDKTINLDLIEKNEIASEVIQNLNYYFAAPERNEASPYNTNTNLNTNTNTKIIDRNEDKSSGRYMKEKISSSDNQQITIIELWEDRDLLISLYQCYSEIWNDNFFDVNKNSSLLLDEIKFIQVLISKKIYENSTNPYVNELKLLLYSNVSTFKIDNMKPNNILRTILNIILLIIRLSEGMDEICKWIKELKKYILFLIFACESAHVDLSISSPSKVTDPFLTSAQEEVSHAVVLVFDFLIEEINSPRRNEISKDIISEFISCRRTLFIVFTIVIEKILTHIDLESNKTTMNTMLSYLNNIKNIIIFQPQSSYIYSPLWKVYNTCYITKNNNKLFTLKDIQEFKINNYMEINNKFSSDEWSYAFQENSTVYKILKDHFNFSFFEKVIILRINEGDRLRLNSDICSKEKDLINKVYKAIGIAIKTSLDVFQHQLLNDIYHSNLKHREIGYEWYKLQKEFFQWKGKWCDLNAFLKAIDSKEKKLKVVNHYSSSFNSFLLYPVYDIRSYLPKFSKYNPHRLFRDIQIESIADRQSQLDSNGKDKGQNGNAKAKANSDHSLLSDISLSESNYNNINPGNANNNNNNNSTLFKVYPELNVKQFTNKSNLFYANTHFSDFIDMYIDLEKIIKYFKLVLENKFNKCIVNINDYYINEAIKTNSASPLSAKVFDAVCLIKITSHKQGRLVVNSEGIHFIEYDNVYYTNNSSNENKEKCIGALFEYNNSSKSKAVYQIQYSEIKQLFRRRYYYKKTAVELFTISNKSYYLNFQSQHDRDDFIKMISDSKNTLLKYPITNELTTLTKLTKDWEQWDISTFELLLLLNNFAGRSFKDLTQYPVFPWVISDYTSDSIHPLKKKNDTNDISLKIRDLTKPIGALGSSNRIEIFKQKFIENEIVDAMDSDGKYFYSSHYSNPFYVAHYLYRLLPFTSCAIELQGEGFDKPARQFFSIPSSFINCMNEVTDVRELIPEFYYLPEMLQNVNNVDFGELNDTPLNNCELPPWAHGQYHAFTIKNRQMIENNYVSSKINDWIDLIFGYKQKGKEGKAAMNIFFNFTYEDAVDIDKVKSEQNDEYLSYISKVDFGQTPSQLFIKPFASRLQKEQSKNQNIIFEATDRLRTFNSTSEHINLSTYKSCRKDIINKMIIYIKCIRNDKVVCVFNNGLIIFFKADDTPYSESGLFFIKEKEVVMPSDYIENNNPRFLHESTKKIVDEDSEIMKTIEFNQPIVVIRLGKFIIKGGFFDGKILIFKPDKQQSFYIQIDDESRVTQLISDVNEQYLIIGTSTGRVYVYKIINTKEITNLLVFHSLLLDHTRGVNHIFICSKLNIMATVSNDKTCNLYTFPLFKLFKVVAEEEFSFDYVFISSSPIPGLILYSKSELKFFSYTINGSLIATKKNDRRCLFSPKIVNDNYNRDQLIFGTQDGCIVIIGLPYFNSKEIELKNENDNLNLPIKCFDVSFDRQTVYYWKLENFNLSVLKYQKEKSEAEESQTKINLFDHSLNL